MFNFLRKSPLRGNESNCIFQDDPEALRIETHGYNNAQAKAANLSLVEIKANFVKTKLF